MASRRGAIFLETNGLGTSRGHSLVAVNPELSIVIQSDENSLSCNCGEDEWLRSIATAKSIVPEMPKIQRVPQMLREIKANKRCYDPVVVSIGPIHHGKSALQPMEKTKKLLALQFTEKRKVSITEAYETVALMAGKARKCYEENLTASFDSKSFSQMMFLDGCFIIEFTDCIVNGAAVDLKMKSHEIAFVRRDLFLLENQIPFEVLQVLMSLRFDKDKGENVIRNFIRRSRAEPPTAHSNGMIKRFIRRYMRESQDEDTSASSSKKTESTQPLHLLEVVRKQLIDVTAFERGGCHLTGEWCSYRSAMELRTVGIHFRPGRAGSRFSDISFEWTGFSSRLTLPPITIDDSTKSLLLNLVAYEACLDTPDDFGVTSFLCFMDSLIDQAEDVKVLRSKGILLNYLGSDQEVADLFNEIAKDLVPNPHGFVRVKKCIENHYTNHWKLWIAEWKHAHFSSPWTCLAFVAAIFALSLSVVQTVLAVIQTELTAHPPKNN